MEAARIEPNYINRCSTSGLCNPSNLKRVSDAASDASPQLAWLIGAWPNLAADARSQILEIANATASDRLAIEAES